MWRNEFINNFKTKTLSIHKITAKLKGPQDHQHDSRGLKLYPSMSRHLLAKTMWNKRCKKVLKYFKNHVKMSVDAYYKILRYHVLLWPKANYSEGRTQPGLCSRPHRSSRQLFIYTSFKQITWCFSLCFLILVCPVSVKFTKPSFFIMCPRDFNCLFLILSVFFCFHFP